MLTEYVSFLTRRHLIFPNCGGRRSVWAAVTKANSADLSTPAWLVQTSADCRVPQVSATGLSSRRVLMSAHTVRATVLSTLHCRGRRYTHLLHFAVYVSYIWKF